MSYVDYGKCPKCQGKLKVVIRTSLNEGSIECHDCGFKSDIYKDGWIIEETGEPLKY